MNEAQLLAAGGKGGEALSMPRLRVSQSIPVGAKRLLGNHVLVEEQRLRKEAAVAAALSSGHSSPGHAQSGRSPTKLNGPNPHQLKAPPVKQEPFDMLTSAALLERLHSALDHVAAAGTGAREGSAAAPIAAVTRAADATVERALQDLGGLCEPLSRLKEQLCRVESMLDWHAVAQQAAALQPQPAQPDDKAPTASNSSINTLYDRHLRKALSEQSAALGAIANTHDSGEGPRPGPSTNHGREVALLTTCLGAARDTLREAQATMDAVLAAKKALAEGVHGGFVRLAGQACAVGAQQSLQVAAVLRAVDEERRALVRAAEKVILDATGGSVDACNDAFQGSLLRASVSVGTALERAGHQLSIGDLGAGELDVAAAVREATKSAKAARVNATGPVAGAEGATVLRPPSRALTIGSRPSSSSLNSTTLTPPTGALQRGGAHVNRAGTPLGSGAPQPVTVRDGAEVRVLAGYCAVLGEQLEEFQTARPPGAGLQRSNSRAQGTADGSVLAVQLQEVQAERDQLQRHHQLAEREHAAAVADLRAQVARMTVEREAWRDAAVAAQQHLEHPRGIFAGDHATGKASESSASPARNVPPLPKYTRRQGDIIVRAVQAIAATYTTGRLRHAAPDLPRVAHRYFSDWVAFVWRRRLHGAEERYRELYYWASLSQSAGEILSHMHMSYPGGAAEPRSLLPALRQRPPSSLSSMHNGGDSRPPATADAVARPPGGGGPTEGTVSFWSKEKELCDLVARVGTQQRLLMKVARERDVLVAQNYLLQQRLVFLGMSEGHVEALVASAAPGDGDPNEFSPVRTGGGGGTGPSPTPAASRAAAGGPAALPVISPDQLQVLIAENKPLLTNPSLRRRDTDDGTVDSTGAKGHTDEPKDPLAPVQQMIMRNPLAAHGAARAIVEASEKMSRVPEDVRRQRQLTEMSPSRQRAEQPVEGFPAPSTGLVWESAEGADGIERRPPNEIGRTAGAKASAVIAPYSKLDFSAMLSMSSQESDSAGTHRSRLVGHSSRLGSAAQHATGHSASEDVDEERETMRRLENPPDVERGVRLLLEPMLAQIASEAPPPTAEDVAASEEAKARRNLTADLFKSHNTRAVKGRIRQIKKISKDESDLRKVADDVQRNLLAATTGGADGAVTLDALQIKSLHVYSILFPIVEGTLRRLRVTSLRVDHLPLYEATTQPIIVIVMNWIERTFARLLHVLTCEDRLTRAKVRLVYLSVRLRAAITSCERDLRYCKGPRAEGLSTSDAAAGATAATTARQLIQLQLAEYNDILKGVTSCRQLVDNLRRELKSSYLGSSPEKQAEIAAETLRRVDDTEDTVEKYSNRMRGNTIAQRRAVVMQTLTAQTSIGGRPSPSAGAALATLIIAKQTEDELDADPAKVELRRRVEAMAAQRYAREFGHLHMEGTTAAGGRTATIDRTDLAGADPRTQRTNVGTVGPSTDLRGASRFHKLLTGAEREAQTLRKKGDAMFLRKSDNTGPHNTASRPSDPLVRDLKALQAAVVVAERVRAAQGALNIHAQQYHMHILPRNPPLPPIGARSPTPHDMTTTASPSAAAVNAQRITSSRDGSTSFAESLSVSQHKRDTPPPAPVLSPQAAFGAGPRGRNVSVNTAIPQTVPSDRINHTLGI